MRIHHRWLKPIVCVAIYLAGGACALADEPPQPHPIPQAIPQTSSLDLSGTWVGRWESCTTHHQGPLRATFCRIDDTHYRVEFHGRFFVVVPFRYAVTLEVVGQDGESVQLSGSSYLGKLLGCYQYTATADGCHFNAGYSSCKDSGRFVLCRQTVCTSVVSSAPTCGCR